MTATAMIESERLAKHYGPFIGLTDVSFEIPLGQIVALVGPNGAGKTTLMRVLTGFFAPSDGTARVAGFDVQSDRRAAAACIGYLPENGPLYPDMTPRSLLGFAGEIRGLTRLTFTQRLAAVTDQCELDPILDKPIGNLSKGLRQRVGMALALLHDPPVLILDEPTSGLDPNQIGRFRSQLLNLKHQKTVILSTHLLHEVVAVADRVLVMHNGRLRFDGAPRDLAVDGSLEARFLDLTQEVPPS